MNVKNTLSAEQISATIGLLNARFEKNVHRHMVIDWSKVRATLEQNPEKLWSLYEMERTGGEPDVVGIDQKTRRYIFFDCSTESPADRRSLCYDRRALDARKEHKPKNCALDVASEMGVELLTEQDYVLLQTLGEFDLKTSSWILTPQSVRSLGGALYADRRYGRVFFYHNGADSYYGARGFRAKLLI